MPYLLYYSIAQIDLVNLNFRAKIIGFLKKIVFSCPFEECLSFSLSGFLHQVNKINHRECPITVALICKIAI